MWPHVGDLDVHYPFSVRSADTVNITMGRYKKGKKITRSDVWEQAGGVEVVINELRKADILNRNTEYLSDIWAQLSITLFGEDLPKNRHWLWVTWTNNRNQVRDRIHLAKENTAMNPSPPESQTQEIELGDQGKKIYASMQ